MADPAMTVTQGQEAPALDSPELYVNRELSWLDFNARVLELTEDPRVPPLERVRFLAIYESNLDEFFMVRVAGLHDQVDAGIDAPGADGLSASDTIDAIAARVRELDRRHARAFEQVTAALAEEGILVTGSAGRVRAAMHLYNDDADVDRLIAAMRRRSISASS